MTVSTTKTYKAGLVGNGSATQFPFDFPVASASELTVTVDGVVKGGGYTVALASVGGTLTFDTAPADGAAILIESTPSFLQPASFANEGAFRPDTFDAVHDRLAIAINWLRDRVLRSIVLPRGKSGDASGIAPGQFLTIDGNGNIIGASGTGNDAALRTDLAATGGAALVGWIRSATGAIARSVGDWFDDQPSVMDFIPFAERVKIRLRTSTADVTPYIQSAIAAVDGTGNKLKCPGGTYCVTQIGIIGSSDFELDTASGVKFKQLTGFDGGILTSAIFLIHNANRVKIGDLNLQGNTTEFDNEHTGIAILSSSNIQIGHVDGRDIGGDVVYVYARTTLASEVSYNISIASITFGNIFRSGISVTGGQVRVGAIINDGGFGYRDFDVEPNTGGDYQPVEFSCEFVRGAANQVSSGDPAIKNKWVRLGHVDLDGARLVNSTPPSPDFPGPNAAALDVSQCESVSIGSLKLRNYDSYPVVLGQNWDSLEIGNLDAAAVDQVETSQKTVFRQVGAAGAGVLTIHKMKVVLAGSSRSLFKADSGVLNYQIGSADISGGCWGSGAGNVGQLKLDAAGATDPIFSNCSGVIANAAITNVGSAIGFNACSKLLLTNWADVTFGTVDYASGSTDVVTINANINSGGHGITFLKSGAFVPMLTGQGASIANVSGGTTVDTECRAAVNAILARMRAGTPSIAP